MINLLEDILQKLAPKLFRLMEKITGKPRYIPDVEYKEKAWVYNLFRFYERLFGREYGLRLEQVVTADNEGIVHRAFYTWEAFFHFVEQEIRRGLSFDLIPVKIYTPHIVTGKQIGRAHV